MPEIIFYQKNTASLENFLKTNQDASLILAQGLGFIGYVMSLVVANAINGGYAVIGVDQDMEIGRRTVGDLQCRCLAKQGFTSKRGCGMLDSCKNYP
jgi:hypothetical protein